MSTTKTEKSNSPIHSLIVDRKRAFANLVMAYLRFNVPSAQKVEVMESEDSDIFILINDTVFKFDVSDYTGNNPDGYIFFNPSNGRIVIEKKNVSKVYKLEVDLLDNND